MRTGRLWRVRWLNCRSVKFTTRGSSFSNAARNASSPFSRTLLSSPWTPFLPKPLQCSSPPSQNYQNPLIPLHPCKFLLSPVSSLLHFLLCTLPGTIWTLANPSPTYVILYSCQISLKQNTAVSIELLLLGITLLALRSKFLPIMKIIQFLS